MSVDLETSGEDKRTWKQFEDLVRRILDAHNYKITVHSPRGEAGFDFEGLYGADKWAIEVKYYRTGRAQPTLIEAAASRVVNNGIGAHARKGMLVVSCVLPPSLRLSLEEKFSIVFVDRIDLRIMASKSPDLVEALDALIEARPYGAEQDRSDWVDPTGAKQSLDGATPVPMSTKGDELCAELKKVPKGRDGWPEYEKLCADILRYLFPNDLEGWHEQMRTDDGLNRFDFVCRIRPATEFWRFVIEDLNSRYALFEFKNYSEEIGQGQILTTEKYLLERGLRRVAIVMTRIGADENATWMAKGAMREHGKLILVVNDEKVCKMLHMRDRGEDPTDLLFQLADDFLLRLSR